MRLFSSHAPQNDKILSQEQAPPTNTTDSEIIKSANNTPAPEVSDTAIVQKKPHSLSAQNTGGQNYALKLVTPVDEKRVAIIIDDLGYNQELGNAFVELPYEMTYAFIPFSPYGTSLAKKTFELDKPVMLHAPMATIKGGKWEDALTPEMNRTEIEALLDSMLSDIKYANGVNNHGGSLFTQTDESMRMLLKELAKRKLYFIDSRTSSLSVAKQYAAANRVLFNQRDVFLDNQKDERAIKKQFDKLVRMAETHGYAIGIAHPYRETLSVLSAHLGDLDAQGIKVVSVVSLLATVEPE